jgi:hypothetical protein
MSEIFRSIFTEWMNVAMFLELISYPHSFIQTNNHNQFAFNTISISFPFPEKKFCTSSEFSGPDRLYLFSMTESQPPSLTSQVAEAMTKAKWSYAVDASQNRIFCLCSNDDACLRLVIHVLEIQHEIIGFVALERRCPSACRPALLRFCHLANYEISIGFFSTDEKDGEVKFRHSVDVEGIVITSTFIDNFIKSILTAMRKRYLKIQKLMSGYSLDAVMAES